jgi:hypothetical protein
LGTDSINVIGMKKIFIIMFLSIISLLSFNSCGDNDYEFVGSRQGQLSIYDRTFALDDRPKSINVAVDVYRKKVKDGYYSYMVKSQEGNEYKVDGDVKPNSNSVLVVSNFRHQDYLGVLHVIP